MKILLKVIAVLGVLIPSIASAELNYNAVQFGYSKTDMSGNSEFDEYGIGVSFSVNNDVFVEGQFAGLQQPANSTTVALDGKSWAIGAGYHTPISKNVDIIIGAGISQTTWKAAGTSSLQDGYNFGIGVRGEITPKIEGSLSVGYLSASAQSTTVTGTGIKAGLGYNFTPKFQLKADIGTNSYSSSSASSSYSSSTYGMAARLFF
jgi:hypothetical protein